MRRAIAAIDLINIIDPFRIGSATSASAISSPLFQPKGSKVALIGWPACCLTAYAENFLSRWGAAAHALGWTPLDLFGVHATVPVRQAVDEAKLGY
jgi:hypothetical protein